jgi:hypothetical protein
MERLLRPDIEVALGSIFDNLPDYASVFGKDPRATYTVLSLATLLSGVGWIRLSNPSGLRYFITSQIVCTLLLISIGLLDIKKNFYIGTPVISALFATILLLLLSPKRIQYSAEVASWTSIFSWSLILFLPGIDETQLGFSVVPCFVVMMFSIATIVVSNLDDEKQGTKKIISTVTAARIIFINTLLMVASRLF